MGGDKGLSPPRVLPVGETAMAKTAGVESTGRRECRRLRKDRLPKVGIKS
jgi:hypothetical protein